MRIDTNLFSIFLHVFFPMTRFPADSKEEYPSKPPAQYVRILKTGAFREYRLCAAQKQTQKRRPLPRRWLVKASVGFPSLPHSSIARLSRHTQENQLDARPARRFQGLRQTFFNSETTVFFPAPRTRAVSRTPLPLIAISAICSFTPGS